MNHLNNLMHNTFKIFLIAFFFVFYVIISNKFVLAQGTSLTIIPPKFELFSNPGETISEKIRVKNNSDAPQTYTVLIEDFTTSGEEGDVVLEEEQSDTSYSLAKWIEPAFKDVILQPNEEKSLSFVVNVPRNAEPGGHYASILFQSNLEGVNVEGGASVAQRIGSLVLLRVSGNVNEKAAIENFSTPAYQEKSPISFLLRVKNDSNTHIRPQGTIVITNLFGKKVAEIPLQGLNVLPGAIRKMETIWDEGNVLGVYTATLIATYGQQKLPLTAAVRFTVIPKTLLIIGFVGGVALIGFILTLIMGRKRFAKMMRVLMKG
ncbi:DUF916 domain-containing protein [Candidatus Beckwithbacteria bacterium]|nr:DUF916 domain-containing protein [Candidatus Beckwithbacteria bacterium]